MALAVGTNSYVTVAEATTYLADYWGAGDWTTLTNTQKEQLLIAATRVMEAEFKPFNLAPYVSGQALTFPLEGSSGVVPPDVKTVQIILAWEIYLNPSFINVGNSELSVKELESSTQQGKTRVEYFSMSDSKKLSYPAEFVNLLNFYRPTSGGGIFFGSSSDGSFSCFRRDPSKFWR